MRITLVFCGLTSAIGWWLSLPFWWVPSLAASGAAAFLPFGVWADSDRMGSNQILSAFLRMLVQMAGAAASVGFWASVGLAGYWVYLAF